MVKIRLARFGAKKRPFYHIVATDSRSRRDSSSLEKIGYYNPLRQEEISINLERVEYWQSVGAQLTGSARRILKQFKKQQSETTT